MPRNFLTGLTARMRRLKKRARFSWRDQGATTLPNQRELRRQVVERHLDVANAAILEMGALSAPMFPERDVKYADVADPAELRRRQKARDRRAQRPLVDVDYVCANGNFRDAISQRFDLVVANHVLEHVPNPIGWLEQVGSLLEPNGYVFLSIPDKRYTFDVMRRETTWVDLYRRYLENATRPDFYDILDHLYFHKDVSAAELWAGTAESKLLRRRYAPGDAVQVAEGHARKDYADVHCHVFTRDSFVEAFAVLGELQLFELDLKEVTHVVSGSNEFHVVLVKRSPERQRYLERR